MDSGMIQMLKTYDFQKGSQARMFNFRQIILMFFVQDQINMSEQKPFVFSNYFSLHPQDAFLHAQYITNTLQSFVSAFKQRIQVQIDYSKSLQKVGKKLQKFINSQEPTPLSYISSAFKVEHEQRSRHSLELAEYLHTQIQIPCQSVLKQHQAGLKRIQKQIRKLYKQGQSVQQSYQRCLKKYYKAKQDWEENMIVNSIINFYPGVTASQRDKVSSKLQDNKRENDEHYQKYMCSLEVFNKFAENYNNTIPTLLKELQKIEIQGITEQSDSIRKLIVSQVNMFKNIQYDLLNISRQMENISPNSQVESFVIDNKDAFQSPIISIYAEGPIVPNRYSMIDCKIPIKATLLQETLSGINDSLFTWQLQNKSNSTLRYAVERLLKLYGQNDGGEGDFLQQFENTIYSNKTVKQIPLDNNQQSYLNLEQAFSHCMEMISGIAQFLKKQQYEQQNKIKSLIQLFQGYLSQHHFYRFISYLTLDQFQNIHDQNIPTDKAKSQHYAILLHLLINKSIKSQDIFIVRLVLVLLFSVKYNQQNYFYEHPLIQNLEIWFDRDFWESAIFEETYELITFLSFSTEKIELKDVYIMKQKNVIFNGLIPYCRYMVMLGQQSSQAKSIMSRICQIYNLYEKQQKDIFSKIDEAEQEKNIEQ